MRGKQGFLSSDRQIIVLSRQLRVGLRGSGSLFAPPPIHTHGRLLGSRIYFIISLLSLPS